ncbi:ribonuclease E activity regulator RraA [Curvivirga aplysinae]|uniref:ribonuclease E activity regulator RraA n=1 Tax=Curvivirga aplysinae TaxID=2529852 RepID=UPI0012BC1B89|nr:ribonuclease E activity regulator RraA [Curvivirga aplysinae]MTI09690.1 ribonuclease E inhibitor RraA [Curvivirga aplysinae]
MSKAAKAAPTTDLSDAYPNKVTHCTLPFKDYGGKTMFAGKIHTVVTMEDNKKVQDFLHGPGDGAVLVVDSGGSMRTAMLGDITAGKMQANGWAGMIINGVIRDAERLRDVDVGVKALGTTPFKSTKNGIGASDVPVAFGNVLFEPGQYVYCDEDGVLLSESPLELPKT